MSPIERHADAEKRLSEHRSSGECDRYHAIGVCPVAMLRNIAYREYTKKLHVSVQLRGGPNG